MGPPPNSCSGRHQLYQGADPGAPNLLDQPLFRRGRAGLWNLFTCVQPENLLSFGNDQIHGIEVGHPSPRFSALTAVVWGAVCIRMEFLLFRLIVMMLKM